MKWTRVSKGWYEHLPSGSLIVHLPITGCWEMNVPNCATKQFLTLKDARQFSTGRLPARYPWRFDRERCGR